MRLCSVEISFTFEQILFAMKQRFFMFCLFFVVAMHGQATESYAIHTLNQVPIYPGCTGDNTQLKKCMNRAVQMHIVKNMNTGLLPQQKSDKPVKSFVLFNISETGKVINVRVNSKEAKLRDELIRVIKLLPDMTPGKLNDKSVVVKYTLPFTYKGRN